MNEVSLDKVLIDEEFECMICCEEHVCAGNLKRCGNKKCTFRMCDKCFDNLESIECPNCRQPIEGKKLKSIPEEAMMEDHRSLVDQLEARRLREGRIQLGCLVSTCRTGTTLQVPFWGIGASISFALGYGIQYACCYGNIPCTVFLGFEMCKDYRRTQAQQNTALLRRIRDFMEPPGYRTSSPGSNNDDESITVENPLTNTELAPAATVIEGRSSS
jgi:hypothetical protein